MGNSPKLGMPNLGLLPMRGEHVQDNGLIAFKVLKTIYYTVIKFSPTIEFIPKQ